MNNLENNQLQQSAAPNNSLPVDAINANSSHTNTLAIVSLVMLLIFSPAALVLGIVALRQIKRTGEKGTVMAIISVILGTISLLFAVLILIVFRGHLSGTE